MTSELAVVLTPLFGAVLLRQPPGRWPVTGAVLAATGLALLSLQSLEVRQGDALVFGRMLAGMLVAEPGAAGYRPPRAGP